MLVSLSQPAMSLSLRKLRRYFDDELVVYSKQGKRVTALGEALRPRVHRLIMEAGNLFAFKVDFDPATTRRTIRLAAPEVIEAVYLFKVAAMMSSEAPLLNIDLMSTDQKKTEDLFLNGADIVIGSENSLDPRYDNMQLSSIELTCLIWENHPTIGEEMSIEQYLEARHVDLSPSAETDMITDWIPEPLRDRLVCVRANHHAAMANILENTDLVLTTNSWLAQRLAHYLPLRLVPLPVKSKSSTIFVQWERHRSTEPFMQWMFSHLIRALPYPYEQHPR